MGARAFSDLLETADVRGLRAYWREASPHLPQPKTRAEAEIIMHRARTEAASVSLRKRAYSHAWLCERDLPSGLPDQLKPSAERLYPIVKSAVGISVNFKSEWLKPAAREIQGAMENAVGDAYAEGRTDPEFVSARMAEAKERAAKALFGNALP